MRKCSDPAYRRAMTVFNDPARWRLRAEEALALARQLGDPEARERLLRIAVSYDDMAVKATVAAQGSRQPATVAAE